MIAIVHIFFREEHPVECVPDDGRVQEGSAQQEATQARIMRGLKLEHLLHEPSILNWADESGKAAVN